MVITGQQVYELALIIIDEVTESGMVSPDNPEYYKKKSIGFLSMLQTELFKQAVIVTELSQEVAVSNFLALTALPYGLAAHLLMDENPNLASFLNARYEELKRKQPTEIQPIVDVNNVLGGMK